MARKILLADDSVTAQNMGRKILADAGYEVVTVNNGSAALKRITEIKPDLIVLDVYMPGYSGLEVCQRLKDSGETAHIPVLLTVGKLEPFKPEEARRAKADAHIIKPFEASELLSALARLEDRMVPQADGPRFSSSVSGVERFGGDGDYGRKQNVEVDTSWKNRLRFPSKKKSEEAEPGTEEAGFRDFRKKKSKTQEKIAQAPGLVSGPIGSFPEAAPSSEQVPGLVPDIPRDITPEELDALSELAAKLDGHTPAAEAVAALAEKVGPQAESVASEAPVAEAKKEEAVAAPATESKAEAKEFEVAAPMGEVPAAATEEKIPVAEVERAEKAVADAVRATSTAEREAATVAGAVASEAPAVNLVNPASLTEEPAPIDAQDEPIFAAAEPKAEAGTTEAVAATAEATAAETARIETVETPGVEAEPAKVEAVEASQAEAPQSQAPKIETTEIEPAKAEASDKKDSVAEEPKQEVATVAAAPEADVKSSAASVEAETPRPSEEELAAALRLLTPATSPAEAGMPAHGTLVATGEQASEAAPSAPNGKRWVAEAVALSPEEAALSLEEEMFRSLAAGSTATAAPEISAETGTTMAAAGLSSDAEATAREAEAVAAEMVEQESGTESSQVYSSLVDARQADAGHDEASQIQTRQVQTSQVQAGQAQTVGEAAADEGAATFADAMAPQETATVAEPAAAMSEPAAMEMSSTATEEQDKEEPKEESLESGGQSDMSKETKGKASKSQWRQIHTPASVAKSDAVEAAKQTEPAEEAPKVMAAAAAAESGPASPATPDPSAIANIVDSVLADLRPKIVEEIAKKLAGK